MKKSTLQRCASSEATHLLRAKRKSLLRLWRSQSEEKDMITFEIALSTPSGIATVYLDDIAEFIATMEAEAVGIERRAGRRAELIGQPVLAGYVGPCWGGRTAEGIPIIRYEDTEAHIELVKELLA
jgi:hypothetical protein